MITVPTEDLVGVLSDVVPFAHPDNDLPSLNAVRLDWDGTMLHAQATDMLRIAWSSWHPADEPEGESQDDLFTKWGGADDPWATLVPLDDAKHLIKVFKLGAKELRVPLEVDYAGGSVTVKRSRDTGYSALSARVEGRMDEFPDVAKFLAEADVVTSVVSVAFGAKLIADFSKVRPRGPMELTFTGATSLTHVRIGERFIGAIAPTRVGDDAERQAA